MASTKKSPEGHCKPTDWRSAGLLWFSRNFFWRKKFGHRIWRVSVDAGLGCPNRDGTLGTGGCVFCNPESFSLGRRSASKSISQQIEEGIRRLKARYGVDRFVAYFQPGSNTYATVEHLRSIYQQAIAHPKVVGLIVGTRPDCVSEECLDLLAELAGRTWVSVEYGLQSIHDRSLKWMHRGHDYETFVETVRRSRGRGFEIGAHVILGLPDESTEDILSTARELARLEINSVKLHNLHAVVNTPLADMVASGEVRLPQFDQYVGYVVDFLEELPVSCVIDRLVGNAPSEYLIGPSWCADKSAVLAAIEAEFRRRGTCQGHAT